MRKRGTPPARLPLSTSSTSCFHGSICVADSCMLATMNWISLCLFLTLALVGPGSCTMVNRTIDDQFGDEVTHQPPVYTPSGGWAQGATCKGCAIRLAGGELDKTVNKTWHDTTVHPHDPKHTITLNFTGSAVYAFNIIANHQDGGVTTETHMTFWIDGEKVGQYDHMPNNTTDFEFRVPVYANSTLPYGEHTLQIVVNGTTPSLVLFDYAIYTTRANSTTPTVTTSSALSSTVHSSSTYGLITYTSTRSAAPQDSAAHTSTTSPTSLLHTPSKYLATVAGVTAALSFICGVAALAIFRSRKTIMLYVRKARVLGRGTRERTPMYRGGPPASPSHLSLDVNFSNSRSSSLIRQGSPRTISHLPSTPPSAIFRGPPPVHRGGPATWPNARVHSRTSPPKHSVDVPRSAVSSSRTGTDHSSGSIAELRRELRSLREKVRELQSQSPRKLKHRLRLVDGPSAEPAPPETSGAGVPVSLASVREEV